MRTEEIRSGARYPKKEGSILLQRLCREAWDAELRGGFDDETRERVRIEALRTILGMATDDDLDVLRRHGAVAMASAYRIGVPGSGSNECGFVTGSLGCSVEVPAGRVVGGCVVMTARTDEDPEPVTTAMPDWVGRLITGQMEAWNGYEDEQEAIVRVNRTAGSPTWGRLLQAIPRTAAYVAACLERHDHEGVAA
jgi:hypothetical protein